MPHAKRYPSNKVHKQPAVPFNEPPMRARIHCHLSTITNVELVPVKNLIITSSTDCSIRVWTLNGTYIGEWAVFRILCQLQHLRDTLDTDIWIIHLIIVINYWADN